MEFNTIHQKLKKSRGDFWFRHKESRGDEYLMLEWDRNFKTKLKQLFNEHCPQDKSSDCAQLINDIHLTIWRSIWEPEGKGCDFTFHLAGRFHGRPVKIWYKVNPTNYEILRTDIGKCKAARDNENKEPEDDTFYKLYPFIESTWILKFVKLLRD